MKKILLLALISVVALAQSGTQQLMISQKIAAGGGVLTIVNTNSGTGASGTPIAITSTTAGNALVLLLDLHSAITDPVMSVTGCGTWAQAPGAAANTGGGDTDIWTTMNATGSCTAATITITAPSNFGYVVYELNDSAGAGTATVDQVSGLSNQMGNPALGPPVTTATSSEFVASAMSMSMRDITAAASGFTFDFHDVAWGPGFAHDLTSTSGTFSASWTYSSFSSPWCGSTVSIKP